MTNHTSYGKEYRMKILLTPICLCLCNGQLIISAYGSDNCDAFWTNSKTPAAMRLLASQNPGSTFWQYVSTVRDDGRLIRVLGGVGTPLTRALFIQEKVKRATNI